MTSFEENFIKAAIGDDYGNYNDENSEDLDDSGNDGDVCNQCNQRVTSPYWCQLCNSSNFQKEFDSWESGNNNIDAFIRDVQLKANSIYKILEWIPYSKFKNVNYIAEGGFRRIYSATFSEGYILYWNAKDSRWKRKGEMRVALKCFNDSQNITEELLNEVQNLYNCNDETSFITRCYGITRHDETNEFMIVMQLMEDGSLRKNLSDIRKMSWREKLVCLSRIAEGLSQLHSIELVHQNFHSGKILFSSISSITPYIAGLSISRDQEKVYGVLPYVAPEVLRGDEYTKAADVYSFGVIMSEVISGTLPFKDVAHDGILKFRICNEKLRPKVPRNVPALVIELMQKCWDDNSRNRLNSRELRNILRAWRSYKADSKLAEQIEESGKMASDFMNSDEIHPGAIYATRCLTDELEL